MSALSAAARILSCSGVYPSASSRSTAELSVHTNGRAPARYTSRTSARVSMSQSLVALMSTFSPGLTSVENATSVLASFSTLGSIIKVHLD